MYRVGQVVGMPRSEMSKYFQMRGNGLVNGNRHKSMLLVGKEAREIIERVTSKSFFWSSCLTFGLSLEVSFRIKF